MNVLELVLVYLIIKFFLPILEKLCELIVNIIHIGVARVSLRLTEIQNKINNIAGANPVQKKNVVGFAIEEEHENEDCSD